LDPGNGETSLCSGTITPPADPSDFVDRRNAEAILADLAEDEGATIGLSEQDWWPAPSIPVMPDYLPDLPRLAATTPTVAQRYVVEIWVEKSTVNDVLLPLHRSYGVNIIAGLGELSDTRCQELVDRAQAHGRPVRILYISDFDPAGMSMPVAVARKIEHRLRTDSLDLDIQVRPVALTHDQCQQYRLPRTPIKESEVRAGQFEGRFGEGATELDALEALHPGELRDIIVAEIERYYDHDLDSRVEEVANAVDEELAELNDEVHSATEIATLKQEYRALAKRINDELRPIAERYQPELQAIADRFNAVREAVVETLEQEAPDPDDYDWPEPEDGEEDSDPLFDSTRGYVEQVDRYKEHQGKPTTRKKRNGKAELDSEETSS
jgi:hypothetical protein